MSTVQPVPSVLTGQFVDGRYRVGEVIGRGAMSLVHLAVDERLDRQVALKVLRPDATDPARFEEETALLCSLDHPNLVRLHDAGRHEGTPYLVLNLLPGTLSGSLAAGGPLPPASVARLGSEIGSALTYLHERGIVHRDIKPSNVLLRDDGSACLADLGAALSIDGPRLTATGLTVGTPMYLAPEQATGDAVTPATDVYSLGLVLLEAATGAPPFGGSTSEALAARVTRSPDIPPALPDELSRAIGAMVDVNPAVRPPAGDVVSQLARASLDAAGGDATSALDADATVVMAPPPIVGTVPARSGDTQVFESAPAVVAPTTTVVMDRARQWLSPSRRRVLRWVLGGAVLLGLLVALASANGIRGDETLGPRVTTTTVAPTATLPPTTTTVAPAPPPPAPSDTCRGDCGGDREGEERKEPRGKEKD